jgi:hypothetical protein
MIPARPELADAVHPAFVQFGDGRRANLSGQVVVELAAYPGRQKPRADRDAILSAGSPINRARVRAEFRAAARARLGRRRVLVRSHGRRVPWAAPWLSRCPWAWIGAERGSMDQRTARSFDTISINAALNRMRARRRGVNPHGWDSEVTVRLGVRPSWAPIESVLIALAAVVALCSPFVAWLRLGGRADSLEDHQGSAALLRSTTTPTRGPDRRSQRRPSVRVCVA